MTQKYFSHTGRFADLVAGATDVIDDKSLASHFSSASTSTHLTDLETHGTTVIAVKYKGGVLNVADRRATAGGGVMYDRADKIFALDNHSLLAVSGSFATSLEIARYLRHAFKYYARSQLQPLSLDGKLAEITHRLEKNVPRALQGIGAFIPVFSAFDTEENEGRIFFYDAMGASFESSEFGSAGSGSTSIRGAFHYISHMLGAFSKMDLDEALRQCLILLGIAAELDTATGGYATILPSAKTVSKEGVSTISEERLRSVLDELA